MGLFWVGGKVILVARNDSEPIEFANTQDLLKWIGEKTQDLKVIREFLDGGYIRDSAGNRYSIADLL